MAIRFRRKMKCIDKQTFYDIDYQVTGLAFAIHNEIGRLWRERIYRNELANRCRDAGFTNVEIEVPLFVSHGDFVKKYRVDLIVQDSIIYELKTVSKLGPMHEKQALNYLHLLGLLHGKLINFRSASVEKRFISTTLLPHDRYDITFDDSQWLALNQDSIWLKTMIMELANDWGAYLETNLFYEAICHFRGGEDKVVKSVEVSFNGRGAGTQKFHLLNQDTAFKLTAITTGIDNFEKHLIRFIRPTKLKAMQWVNFNHQVISFKTLLNPSR